MFTGVGFVDKIHRQTGVAPNGIELHPVTGVSQIPLDLGLFTLDLQAVRSIGEGAHVARGLTAGSGGPSVAPALRP